MVPGELLAGRYRLVRPLGAGTSGEVWEAFDGPDQAAVALKILHEFAAGDEEQRRRFVREVEASTRVRHHNVVFVETAIELPDRRVALVMELLRGVTFEELLANTSEPLTVTQLLTVMRDTARALSAVHAAGIVHRDLKPANIFLHRVPGSEAMVAKIVDFGISKFAAAGDPQLTNAGMILGSPRFMSPEQVRDASNVDHRADIWAFGVILFHATTGRWPYDAPGYIPLLHAIATSPPKNIHALAPWLNPSVRELIERCLAPLDQRISSAAELVRRLDGALGADTGRPARQDEPPPTTRSPPTFEVSPPLPKSLLVAAFVNDGDAEDPAIVGGLQQEVIGTLSALPGLHVRVARDAETAWAASRPSDGALVLETVVSGASGRIRINGRLVRSTDGERVWATRIEEPRTGLLALCARYVAEVAEGLAVASPTTPPPAPAPSPGDVAALYLRGRNHLRLAQAWEALACFSQAQALAPDEPKILSALAATYVRMWFLGRGEGLAGQHAADFARRAISLAPHSAEAHQALALVLLHGGSPAAAVSELCAITDRVDFAPAHETLAVILDEVGLLEEGREHLARSLRIEPNNPVALLEMARQHGLMRHWDLAERYIVLAEACGNMPGTTVMRVRVALWRGDREAARATAQRMPEWWEGGELVAKTISGSAPVDVEGALALARSATTSPRRRAMVGQIQTEVAAFVGDTDWAMRALEQAVGSGLTDLVWFRDCPGLAKLRRDPRAAAIERTLEERAIEVIEAFQQMSGASREKRARRS